MRRGRGNVRPGDCDGTITHVSSRLKRESNMSVDILSMGAISVK